MKAKVFCNKCEWYKVRNGYSYSLRTNVYTDNVDIDCCIHPVLDDVYHLSAIGLHVYYIEKCEIRNKNLDCKHFQKRRGIIRIFIDFFRKKTRIDVYNQHNKIKKPDTVCQSIKYINTNGVLAVIGDYGHWMFCREFHPSTEGNVSDGYWIEKCEMEGLEYDTEGTQKELQSGINGGLEEYGYKEEKLEAMIEYYKECLRFSDTEWEYVAYAHGNMPGFIDHEQVPHVKKTKPWLRCVFDGFDEICRRLKANEPIKLES
jgi:hypothetical protein